MIIVAVYFGLVPNYTFGQAMETVPANLADIQIELSTEVQEASLLVPSDIAVTVSSRSDMLQLLLWVSGAAVLLLAGLGAWVGWILAGRMLRPLQEVNAAAKRAAAGHLDHRVAMAGPHDEISELADTFDEMLGKIERSVEAHRRFAANASHELRTPLATNRAMLDVALASPTTKERELLARLRETNERSIATVESLLDLAEVEAVASTMKSVDLAALAATVVDECAAEAENVGIVITTRLDAAEAIGDETLLHQLVLNLVQNAVRHNVPGGAVTASTMTQSGAARLTVNNTGEALSADEAARFADPFHRGRGRTSDAAARGRGLGLSIVSAIVERHNGELDIAANETGGLTVTVTLPQAP